MLAMRRALLLAVELVAIAVLAGCTAALELGVSDAGPPDAALEDAPEPPDALCGDCASGVCIAGRCCAETCGSLCMPQRFETRAFPVGGEPRWVFFTDLNDDGYEDLVIPAQLDSITEIAWGGARIAGAAPTVTTRVPLGRISTGMSFVDLDGDDRLDLLAVVQPQVSSEPFTIRGARALGDRRFEVLPPIAQPGTLTWLASLDANRDGRTDLLVRVFEDDCVGLRLRRADGSFAPHQCIVPFSSNNEEERIARTDMDGDGVDELLELRGSPTGGLLYQHHFAADGTVQRSDLVPAPLGVEPFRFDVLDLDHDGRTELVVLSRYGPRSRATIRTDEGVDCELPAGFGATDFLSDESVTGAGDLDGDGLLDLAGLTTCAYCTGNVYVHLGRLDP